MSFQRVRKYGPMFGLIEKILGYGIKVYKSWLLLKLAIPKFPKMVKMTADENYFV